ncbi:MAG: DUF4383 domain-containing protein [Actinomycetota bacterium]
MATVARQTTGAQKIAKGFGVFYIALGIVGFVFTGFSPFIGQAGDSLLGLVDLNVFHNIAHIGIGALLVIGARINSDVASGTMLGVAAFYTIATIIGFRGSLQGLINTPGGVFPLGNLFHAGSALFLLAAGLGSIGKGATA